MDKESIYSVFLSYLMMIIVYPAAVLAGLGTFMLALYYGIYTDPLKAFIAGLIVASGFGVMLGEMGSIYKHYYMQEEFGDEQGDDEK